MPMENVCIIFIFIIGSEMQITSRRTGSADRDVFFLFNFFRLEGSGQLAATQSCLPSCEIGDLWSHGRKVLLYVISSSQLGHTTIWMVKKAQPFNMHSK